MPTPAKQTAHITFRCAARLKTKAQKMAEDEGKSLTVLLRALLHDHVRGRRPSPAVLQAITDTRHQLKKIGVNLNQAARVLNAGEYPKGLRALVEAVAAKVEAMHDLLARYHLPLKP